MCNDISRLNSGFGYDLSFRSWLMDGLLRPANGPFWFISNLLVIFLLAGLTDCLDGFIARRFNQITTLGKVLDPIADKLMTASVLFCLSWLGAISWVALGVIFIKEVYMGCGAAVCLKRKLTVAADIYGKAATLLFYPAVLLCWPWHGIAALNIIGQVLIYISVACSVVAAVHYTLDSVKKWNEMKAGMNAH